MGDVAKARYVTHRAKKRMKWGFIEFFVVTFTGLEGEREWLVLTRF